MYFDYFKLYGLKQRDEGTKGRKDKRTKECRNIGIPNKATDVNFLMGCI